MTSPEPPARWTDWQGRPLNPAGDEIRRQEWLATQARKAAEAAEAAADYQRRIAAERSEP